MTGMMSPETRLDDRVPLDEGRGSQEQSDIPIPKTEVPLVATYVTDNVSSPPTAAELDGVFGAQDVGFVGVLIDGGGAGVVYLVVRSRGDLWWHEQFVKAV